MKVKYRIVREVLMDDPKTGIPYTHRIIIKAGFSTKQAAEKWNAKHGNSGYIIELY